MLKKMQVKPIHLLVALVLAVLGLVLAGSAYAQSLSLNLGGAAGAAASGEGTVAGRVVQLLGIITVLSLAPSILIMMTCFTRIIVVLSFLRTALGIQQTPPNMVLMSLALFLTFFIMAPTFKAGYEAGVKPLMDGQMEAEQAFDLATSPFKDFMLKHTREADLKLFVEMSKAGPFEKPEAIPLHIVIPSFMISELRRAFEIGFMLFLPFLIIDMVTASILMSMGMMMLPPVMISLPFKIIFFVLVDGWYLLVGSLVKSYDVGAIQAVTSAAGAG